MKKKAEGEMGEQSPPAKRIDREGTAFFKIVGGPEAAMSQ